MTREEIMQLNTDYLNGCESEHKMNELFSYVLEQEMKETEMPCVSVQEMQKCKDIVKKYTPKQQPCDDTISRQYLLNNCVVDKVTMPYVPINKIQEAPPVTQKSVGYDDAISRILTRMWNCRGKHTTSIDKVAMEQIIRDELSSVNPQPSKHFIDGVHAMGYREGYKDAQKQKTGHWIHFAQSDDCSECGWSTGKYISPSNYCPNCGAKMVEPQESNTEKHKPCVNYEDGCEEWAGCPCIRYKAEVEPQEQESEDKK